MSKVYRQKPLAPDELLGRAEFDGRVFESRLGPDHVVGQVELDSGRIFESRFGPDKHVGRIALDSGKVYRVRLGPDEYLGRVDPDGKFYRHKPLAPDEYVGKIDPMPGYAQAGAAFLLLVMPAWQEAHADKDQAPPSKPAEAGEEGQP